MYLLPIWSKAFLFRVAPFQNEASFAGLKTEGHLSCLPYLFVLRFYGPVNPIGHVERGQFT